MRITPHIFDAFLKCATKCHLRSLGEIGSGNEYAEWVRDQDESYELEAARRLQEGVPETERVVALPATEDLKAAKWRLAVDLVAQTPDRSADSPVSESRPNEIKGVLSGPRSEQLLESCLHAVECVPSEGRGKPAQFVPIRFVFRNKLTKDDRLLLAFDALALSQVLGRAVILGKIIHGDDHATLKVKTSALTGEVRKRIEKLTALLSSPAPPDLVLNRHCAECEFQARCRKMAVEKDDLSLLATMSAKERQKLRGKGIFTVTQLSYTFRPRRRPKRQRDKREKYHHSLKALAIREQKIHIVGSPELKIEGTPVYLDVEGLPDRDFYYLIGLRIGNGDSAVQHSLWADTVEDEGKIWREFLAILETVEKPVLVHYGSYETMFFQRMSERRHNPPLDSATAKAINSAVNVLSVLFAQVYFPTFSNGLKEIGRFLAPELKLTLRSGIESIPLRLSWEKDRTPELKEHLLAYNQSDCLLLWRLSELIQRVCAPETKSETDGYNLVGNFVQTDEMPRTREPWEMFSPAVFAIEDFKFINKCAYFDYQREKVFVRTAPKVRRIIKRDRYVKPSRYHANSTVSFRALHCPDCGCEPVTPPLESEHLFFDLKFSNCGVKRWITRFKCETASCPECRSRFCHPDRPSHRHKYGNALMSWSVYLATHCGLNMNRTRRFMADVFGLSLPDCQYFVFKRVLAARYEALSQEIFLSLLGFQSLHIDETSVNLKRRAGYVWVLASVDRVFYFYRPTREAAFLSEMLATFNGVLVSDFYSGYDALKCDQQKCLIHFMRDINEDLLKCPFDCELKSIAERFASLLRAIVESIDRYGLKHRHLAKHGKEVARFLGWLHTQEFSSDTANSYKRRLAKSGQRMFTFIEHDDVPWNNNNAEHAIKRFAKYRRETGGRFTEASLKEYLILATVFETCEFNNLSALRFLLSGETTLAGLLKLAGRRSGGLSVDRNKRQGAASVLGEGQFVDGPNVSKQGAEVSRHGGIEAESGVADKNQGIVCLESSPGLSKNARKWRFEVVEQRSASCLGGLVAVEGLIQQFGLWTYLEFERTSERRLLAMTGISEKAMITQLLYSSCAGGISLADAETLGNDALARQLANCRKFASKSILQHWLADKTNARLAKLHRVNARLVNGIVVLTDAARKLVLQRSLWRPGTPSSGEQTLSDILPVCVLHQSCGLGSYGARCFYAIAGIAHNLLAALKLIYLPDECLDLNTHSLQRRVIFLPTELHRHARRMCVRVHVPAAWQGWWQRLAEPLKLPVISA